MKASPLPYSTITIHLQGIKNKLSVIMVLPPQVGSTV
jgi:hypothetical protein